MDFSLTLKPKKITATTKQELMKKIEDRSIWSSWDKQFQTEHSIKGNYLFKTGSTMRSRTDGTVRLYNLQKLRRKTKVTTRTITRGKNKGKVEKNVEVIRRGHWVAYVYDLPFALVKHAKQNTRNFEVTVSF